MRHILCFGDSNTFGFIPKKGSRYPYEVRWTGALQRLLGPSWRVLEDGLNARTTVLDDPLFDGRRGADVLPGRLECQRPLDLVILMLGTNDVKPYFSFSAANIASGMEVLVNIVLHFDYGGFATPKVLVVSPIHLHEDIAKGIEPAFDADSLRRSKELTPLYKQVAALHGCDFLDAAAYAEPSAVDGVHMEPEGHRKLAEVMAEKVRAMFA